MYEDQRPMVLIMWFWTPRLEAVEATPIQTEWPENKLWKIPDKDGTCLKWNREKKWQLGAGGQRERFVRGKQRRNWQPGAKNHRWSSLIRNRARMVSLRPSRVVGHLQLQLPQRLEVVEGETKSLVFRAGEAGHLREELWGDGETTEELVYIWSKRREILWIMEIADLIVGGLYAGVRSPGLANVRNRVSGVAAESEVEAGLKSSSLDRMMDRRSAWEWSTVSGMLTSFRLFWWVR